VIQRAQNRIDYLTKVLLCHIDLFDKVEQIHPFHIVKVTPCNSSITINLHFTDKIKVKTSELIMFYQELDSRVRPYLVILKFWALRHGFIGDDKMPTNTLIMLALFYLQAIVKPVIPTFLELNCLADEFTKRVGMIECWNCGFCKDISKIKRSTNISSCVTLVRGFFNQYATVDYKHRAICLNMGICLCLCLFVSN